MDLVLKSLFGQSPLEREAGLLSADGVLNVLSGLPSASPLNEQIVAQELLTPLRALSFNCLLLQRAELTCHQRRLGFQQKVMALLLYHATKPDHDILAQLYQNIYLEVSKHIGSPAGPLRQLTEALSEELYFPREGRRSLLAIAYSLLCALAPLKPSPISCFLLNGCGQIFKQYMLKWPFDSGLSLFISFCACRGVTSEMQLVGIKTSRYSLDLSLRDKKLMASWRFTQTQEPSRLQVGQLGLGQWNSLFFEIDSPGGLLGFGGPEFAININGDRKKVKLPLPKVSPTDIFNELQFCRGFVGQVSSILVLKGNSKDCGVAPHGFHSEEHIDRLLKDKEGKICKNLFAGLSPSRVVGQHVYDFVNNEPFKQTGCSQFLSSEEELGLQNLVPLVLMSCKFSYNEGLNKFLQILAKLSADKDRFEKQVKEQKLFLVLSSAMNEVPSECLNEGTREAVCGLLDGFRSKLVTVRLFKDLVLNVELGNLLPEGATGHYLQLVMEVYLKYAECLLDTMPTEKIIFLILNSMDRRFFAQNGPTLEDFLHTLIAMESLKTKLLSRLIIMLHFPDILHEIKALLLRVVLRSLTARKISLDFDMVLSLVYGLLPEASLPLRNCVLQLLAEACRAEDQATPLPLPQTDQLIQRINMVAHFLSKEDLQTLGHDQGDQKIGLGRGRLLKFGNDQQLAETYWTLAVFSKRVLVLDDSCEYRAQEVLRGVQSVRMIRRVLECFSPRLQVCLLRAVFSLMQCNPLNGATISKDQLFLGWLINMLLDLKTEEESELGEERALYCRKIYALLYKSTLPVGTLAFLNKTSALLVSAADKNEDQREPYSLLTELLGDMLVLPHIPNSPKEELEAWQRLLSILQFWLQFMNSGVLRQRRGSAKPEFRVEAGWSIDLLQKMARKGESIRKSQYRVLKDILLTLATSSQDLALLLNNEAGPAVLQSLLKKQKAILHEGFAHLFFNRSGPQAKLLHCRGGVLLFSFGFCMEYEMLVIKDWYQTGRMAKYFMAMAEFVLVVAEHSSGYQLLDKMSVSVQACLRFTLEVLSQTNTSSKDIEGRARSFLKMVCALAAKVPPPQVSGVKSQLTFTTHRAVRQIAKSSKIPYPQQMAEIAQAGFRPFDGEISQYIGGIDLEVCRALGQVDGAALNQHFSQQLKDSQSLLLTLRRETSTLSDKKLRVVLKEVQQFQQSERQVFLKFIEYQQKQSLMRKQGKNMWKKKWNQLRRWDGSWKAPSFVYQWDLPYARSRLVMQGLQMPFVWAFRNLTTKEGSRPFLKPKFTDWKTAKPESPKPESKYEFIKKPGQRGDSAKGKAEQEKELLELPAQLITPLCNKTVVVTLTSSQVILELGKESKPTHVAIADYQPSVYKENTVRLSLKDLRKVRPRRYLQRKSCVEIETRSRASYLLFFEESKQRDEFLAAIQPAVQSAGQDLKVQKKPQQQFLSSKMPQKWVDHRISNFRYLMWLNRVSGRSYLDLSQYPVLPWTLVTPDVSRDLSLNIGSHGSKQRVDMFRKRFEDKNDLELFSQYHFGTFYSSPAIVCNFLLRLGPFSEGTRVLQSGSFDVADRLFFSFEEVWQNVLSSTGDVRELTPQFYSVPEIFINLSNFPLGVRQDGQRVGDVVLPAWCSQDPYRFVEGLRTTLESEKVSRQLSSWIDLVFGMKLRGPHAVQSLNVFHPLVYEDSISFDRVTDPKERMSFETQVAQYGQTPSQLIISAAHPLRKKSELLSHAYLRLVTDPHSELRILKQRQGREEGDRTLLIKFLKANFFAQLRSSGQIVITEIEKDKRKENPFHLVKEREEKINIQVKQDLQLCPAVECPPADFINQLELAVVGGYWGGNVSLASLQSKKPRILRFSYDVVTAVKVLDSHRVLGLGNEGGVLLLVKYNTSSTFKEKWRTSLGSPVTDICFHEDCSAVVSATAGGKVFVHSVESKDLLACLRHPSGFGVRFARLSTNPFYALLFYSSQDGALYSYSVNGQFLAKAELPSLVALQVEQDSGFMDTVLALQQRSLLTLKSPFLEEKKKLNIIRKDQARLSYMTMSRDRRILTMSNESGLTIVVLDTESI